MTLRLRIHRQIKLKQHSVTCDQYILESQVCIPDLLLPLAKELKSSPAFTLMVVTDSIDRFKFRRKSSLRDSAIQLCQVVF